MIPKPLNPSLGQQTLSTPYGPLSFVLMRSPQRKRTMEVQIRPNGQAYLKVPQSISENKIREFVHQKAEWILKKIEEAKQKRAVHPPREFREGEEFLFLGQARSLKYRTYDGSLPTVELNPGELLVAIPSAERDEGKDREAVRIILSRWYRRQADGIFKDRVGYWAGKTGLYPQKVTVKAQRSLWGSCLKYSKSINLNWQLVAAPMEVIDYVLVHELCHLKEANHSRAFWDLVEAVCPDYRSCRRWLRENGYKLKIGDSG